MSLIIVGIVGAGIVATVATVKAVDGAVQANKAKKAAEIAQIEVDKNKNLFANLDTSNPYLNMENTMEDLSVNTQAAEFSKQQSMQSQANVMNQMKGAAGGSGIAALAQSMAQQGSLDAQKSAASIAQQESANQKAAAAESGRLQGMERQGELISRDQEFGKVDSMLQMSADELAQAKLTRKQAKEQMYEGAAEMGQAGVDAASQFG
tara:strand:+ start:342 stop:962 length:621 start_codon:yes stop_codon:yes gene_type:complete